MRLFSLLTLVGVMLAHGTVLVCVTWAATATILRRSRAALMAAVWTVVLIKFLVPPVFPPSFGYSSIVELITSKAKQIVTPVSEDPKSSLDSGAAGHSNTAIDVSPKQSPLYEWLPIGIVAIYVCCLLVLVFRSLRYWRNLRRHLYALPDASLAIQTEVALLAERLRLRRVPKVKNDLNTATPFVTGLWVFTLVIPDRMLADLQPMVRSALLIHELAHIRRGDLLVRWLQNIARLVFFFWPPVWWACRRLERYAEIACDEWAIRLSSVKAEAYADALLSIARGVRARPWPACEVGLSSSVGTMSARFERIFQSKSSLSPRMSWLILLLVFSWGTFVLSGPALGGSSTSPDGSISNQQPAETTEQSSNLSVVQERNRNGISDAEKENLGDLAVAKRKRSSPSNRQRDTKGSNQTQIAAMLDQKKPEMIDINGDEAISDYEKGYSAAQAFNSFRTHDDAESERKKNIERRAQERLLTNRLPKDN
jgi:beta-lactamase regulating signal transducer with metallopeptidase domain